MRKTFYWLSLLNAQWHAVAASSRATQRKFQSNRRYFRPEVIRTPKNSGYRSLSTMNANRLLVAFCLALVVAILLLEDGESITGVLGPRRPRCLKTKRSHHGKKRTCRGRKRRTRHRERRQIRQASLEWDAESAQGNTLAVASKYGLPLAPYTF